MLKDLLNKFELEKIYLDSIDEKGNCIIIYWAKLKIAFLKFSFSSIIFSDEKNQYYENVSFKRVSKPIIKNTLNLKLNNLEISGSWQKIQSEFKNELFSQSSINTKLIVEWICHQPLAKVKLNYKEREYNGLGYVEKILLTLRPWLLPIDELRWGRFLNENYSVVWINWKGSNPLNLIYLNGIEYNDAIFEDNQVIFNNNKARIMFNNPINFKYNKLNDVVKNNIILKQIINYKFLNSIESKFKSESSLFINNELICSGWSLYELVTWEK